MKTSRFFVWLSLLATTLLSGCGDSNNNTPMVFPTGLTVTNFQKASVAIGQATFTAYSSSTSARATTAHSNDGSYGSPLIHNGILYLSDFYANRVLGYNSVPTTNGASADFVLGQADLVSSGPGTSASMLNGPGSVRYANGKFFVTDYYNNRILIWNTPPTTTGVAADVVVGKADFTSSNCTSGSAGLCFPDDMFVVGTKLIVADTVNNRVLIWNTIPATSGVPADVVLGQGDFTLVTQNDDDQDGIADVTPSNRTLQNPVGIWSDGTKLIVCDFGNNRVLIWNTFPTANFAAANVVLGQNDFTLYAENDDNQDGIADPTPSARTLFFPYYVTSNGSKLFVADANNHRVLMWDTIPTSNFATASKVLGQATFTANTPNDDNQDGISDATPTARTLYYPTGVYIFDRKLFVSDNSNSRFLIFNF